MRSLLETFRRFATFSGEEESDLARSRFVTIRKWLYQLMTSARVRSWNLLLSDFDLKEDKAHLNNLLIAPEY